MSRMPYMKAQPFVTGHRAQNGMSRKTTFVSDKAIDGRAQSGGGRGKIRVRIGSQSGIRELLPFGKDRRPEEEAANHILLTGRRSV